jgi:shikimate kinase
MDKLIVNKLGMSIPEIVEIHGWETFRDVESQVAKDVSKEDMCVIDTGGGVVLRPENVAHLRRNGLVFWLQCRPRVIAERIREGKDRPSLTGSKSFLEEIEDVLEERTPKYSAACDHAVDTTGLGLGEVAERIMGILEEKWERRIPDGKSKDTL